MFRQEKKFTFPERYIESVRTDILKSKLLMSNTYENRFVNTLYLDSPDFVNYNENLTGIGKRSKARIRWYSKTKFGKITQRTEVFLEIKLRSNIFGTKIIEKINLPPDLLNFSSNKLISHIRKELPNDYLFYIDQCATFSLGVSYEREYFEDFSNQLRVTVDSNLIYARPNENEIFNCFQLEEYHQEYCILELKYSESATDNKLSLNFDSLNVTPGRHSKYTTGLYTIYR